ncbi:MAG: HD domain-containing protein [Planctomycetes bacterium]|nr:HD domain-containing protein [Planctomycetota bacterium]
METLQSLVTGLMSTLNTYTVHECVASVCENILKFTEADRCVIYLMEKGSDELFSGAYATRGGGYAPEKFVKVGTGIAGWVAARGAPLILDAAGADPRFLEEWPLNGEAPPLNASVIAVPLISFDSFVGVVEVVRTQGEGFRKSLITDLQPLANIAGLAIPRETDDGFARLAEVCIRFLEEKDRYTHGHSIRVMKYSLMIAEGVGLPHSQMEELRLCALLHDIGKVIIKDSLLGKPGRLTSKELQTIRMHPTIGFNIVEKISKTLSRKIRSHHERFDGNGYPDRLQGDNIPLASRIICVADTLDAITSDRPYRPARGIDVAIEEIKKHTNTQFDPALVEALLKANAEGRLHLVRV